MNYDVIVIGGGAAGLFCARGAGLRGRRVLVLEHQARLGNKILISGGGRCNFTNVCLSPWGTSGERGEFSASPSVLSPLILRRERFLRAKVRALNP